MAFNKKQYNIKYNHDYYFKHEEERIVYNKIYHSSVEYKKKRKEKRANSYKNDPCYKIECCLRRRLLAALNGNIKYGRTKELLGCSYIEFKQHIEKQFQTGMTWDNWGNTLGKWVIDHINPCSSFDLSNPEHQKFCFLFINLRPLWWEDNAAKGDKQMTDIFTNANKN